MPMNSRDVITLVFFPLELREKYQARKHRLADTD